MQTAPASSAGAAASTETSHGARVAEVLETARQAPSEEERLRAVRWLAEHAEPKDFDALQAIQINDPSHEVRNAAEAAVNALRQRHAEAQWPGVPQDVDPQGYMREMRPPP